MNDNEYKIVRVTNISDFDFTGELGARFGGRDFFVPAGESLLLPYSAGHHLATHLARQILLRKAPERDDKQFDGKGSSKPLWDDSVIDELKSKIISEEYEEDKTGTKTEADILADKVAELNKVVRDDTPEQGGNANASQIVPTDEVNSENVYKDKAEVISALKTRGVVFDARASKDELEGLLN